MTTTKSAIRECRDQLFLNRAVSYYLSRVASNIGMDRPAFGFHDDSLWRAVVRRGALDYMQIANLFRDWLDVIVGPRHTVSSVLSQNGVINDDFLMITDPFRLPQRGTVVLNEGLPSAKTFFYSFLDPVSGKMDIDGALTAAITSVVTYAEGTLLADYNIGATSLKLRQSEITTFPVVTTPITLLIGSGTTNEEVVQLTAHATPEANLTVSALTKNHIGPKSSPTTSRLTKTSAGGTVIFLSDTENFPNEGLLYIKNTGAGLGEYIEYYDNDVSQNMLSLRDKLVNTYTVTTTSVTLMIPGEKVQLAQVQVKGVGWEVFQTEARKIQIYLPRNIRLNRLVDASYLHENYSSMPSTTVAAGGVLLGAKILPVVNASAFPTAGVLRINSGGGADERIGFARIDRYSTVLYPYLPSGGFGIPLGATVLHVEDAREIYAAGSLTKSLILSRGLGSQETVTWTSINLSKNTITLLAATVNNHASFDTCEVSTPNNIFLNTGLAFAHPAGHTVTLEEDLYTATDLTIGDPTVAPFNPRRFQGHYVYNPGTQARRNTGSATTLNENLTGPVSLLIDQITGRTSVEVVNAALFDATGQFSITVGRYRGVEETLETSGVTLKDSVTGVTVLNPAIIGAYSITLSAGGGALLPQPAAGAPYGYRILLNPGVNAELVSVYSISGDVVTLETALTKNYAGGEVVQMVSDVIELSGSFIYDHEGIIPYDQRLSLLPEGLKSLDRVNLVEELRTYIKLTALTNFPAVLGTALFNFGQTKVLADTRSTVLVAAGATKIPVVKSSHFPSSNFILRVSKDEWDEEQKVVSVNSPEFSGVGVGGDGITAGVGVATLAIAGAAFSALDIGKYITISSATSSNNDGVFLVVAFPAPNQITYANASGGTTEGFTGSWSLTGLFIVPALFYSHPAKTKIEYNPGDELTLEYTNTATGPNRLVFEEGIYLPTTLLRDIPVAVTAGDSEPISTGTDYPLNLPYGWEDTLNYIFDRGRAAGVQVVVISDK